jgi:hypothetical protein
VPVEVVLDHALQLVQQSCLQPFRPGRDAVGRGGHAACPVMTDAAVRHVVPDGRRRREWGRGMETPNAEGDLAVTARVVENPSSGRDLEYGEAHFIVASTDLVRTPMVLANRGPVNPRGFGPRGFIPRWVGPR